MPDPSDEITNLSFKVGEVYSWASGFHHCSTPYSGYTLDLEAAETIIGNYIHQSQHQYNIRRNVGQMEAKGEWVGWWVTFIRAHLHQRGAGPPAGAGSNFRAGRVFTLARVRAQFNFTGAPFRGTGSLIYKYRPISAPYSCGCRRRIAPCAIPAGARCGGRAGPRRCKQHHTIPSN